jgi:hypothetical protein
MSVQIDSLANPEATFALRDWFRPRKLAGRLRKVLIYQFRKIDAGETFVRLIQSKHVTDLRLIAVITLFCAMIFPVVTFTLVGWHLWHSKDDWPFFHQYQDKAWIWYVFFGEVGALGLPIIGGFWTLAAGILAWCYQSGNVRLGIVDLFACEMTTLCRVCTIIGLTKNCTSAFEQADDHQQVIKGFDHFDSAEVYTPIFDANAKSLEVLDVSVITNITSFYTYWKAMRDAFRKVADSVGGAPIDLERWKGAMRNVVFMQFLAFESAREAINDLIEFEPNHAENTITILLSELPAFRFLLNQFPNENDVHHQRLILRRSEYPRLLEALEKKIDDGVSEKIDINSKYGRNRAKAWNKASKTLDALRKCYLETFLHAEDHDPAVPTQPTASSVARCS